MNSLNCSIARSRDRLDEADYINKNHDFEERGFGIWSLGSDYRSRGEGVSDHRAVVVVYDNEKFDKIKTGKRWTVELRRYRYRTVVVEKGWGSSRTKRSQVKMFYRSIDRAFLTRGEAIDFAERMLNVIKRVKETRERLEDS